MVSQMSQHFPIIVIGAGHAGCEAAYASARMGVRTLLLTMNPDTIALLSCNPAMGGLAKGHLIREIDALGGVMGIASDQNGIQFRTLNTSKGPAVRAPRAQCDKRRYSHWMKHFIENVPNLEMLQGTVERLIHTTENGRPRITGVEMDFGTRITCDALIITTGTFLDGIVHVGGKTYSAGRAGEKSADDLSRSFLDLGLQTGRLKTGTPPRLDKRTINWAELEEQPGDNPPQPFSYTTRHIPLPQVSCHITYTNERTHEIIRANLGRSAMYGGHITSIGPRYCPSIEDKCVRFAEKDRHQIFLEPEGLDTNEIYANGISTSLPEDTQRELVATIPGLENARIIRVGYAIEYTYVLPSQINSTVAVKDVDGLYLAGQINGTTGYEEAGAQGLMAAVNAVLQLRNQPPFGLQRNEAYIGVLLDDLVTKEHREPYRMFTSRAEYRLLLRQDNADLRLTDYAHKLGLISDDRYRQFDQYRKGINAELDRLKSTTFKKSTIPADTASRYGLDRLESGIHLHQLLARPEITYQELRELGCVADELSSAIAPEDLERAIEQVELAVKYEGYIVRQHAQVQRDAKLESTPLPPDMDYDAINGLRSEARQKLATIRPETIGQAGRVAGVNPADISILLIHLKTRKAAA